MRSSGFRITNHCSHQLLPNMQPQSPQAPLSLPHPHAAHSAATMTPLSSDQNTCQRVTSPDPVTLTTAQTKRCHLNHKHQSNQAGPFRQSSRKRERERDDSSNTWAWEMPRDGRCTRLSQESEGQLWSLLLLGSQS